MPVVELDANGTPCFVNRTAQRLIARTGLDASGLLPPTRTSLHREALATGGCVRDAAHPVEGLTLTWSCQPLERDGHTLWYGDEVAPGDGAPGDDDHIRYRLLVDHSTDVISRHGRDGRFLFASPAIRKLLGYTPEEVIGISAYDLFHPDDRRAVFDKDPRIFHDHGFYLHLYRIRHKAGHYVWFETTSVTHRDGGTGELIDILCVSRDVSRRVATERERERLARAVESTTDYVLFVELGERLGSANRAARGRFGTAATDAGAPLEGLYRPGSLRRLREEVRPALGAQGSWQGELEMQGPGGEAVPVLTVALTDDDPDGPAGRMTLLNRDIRERKNAEAQAQKHQQEIAHANRLAATGELASQVAHELNQPLATTSNYASGMLNVIRAAPDRPCGELAAPLQKLQSQVQRMNEILKRIRASVRRGHVRRTSMDLAAVLDRARAHCEWRAEAAGVTLRLDTAADLPAADADPVQVEQVIVNLIMNAVEACAEMVPERRLVEIAAWGEDTTSVAFAVRDHGPGISPGLDGRIFETFFTTKREGLGMGLSISASIMEALGGELRLAPAPADGGCRFVGTLCRRDRRCNGDATNDG
ncbi:Adaptive-response sensory-kinase SasA [wastewater metagenome]|uniref:Adaptive-response sensory-kinase SasA n=2 Tax=unclassified sequences TaxID=12908 RepID=A0A5B8RHT8_9ZZZZ|nr:MULTISPECIES: PAS domain S-box protein [Arhodomonas]QEA06505.1 adaptive-response sensory-kinase SasA [uncultured organism]